MPTTSEAKLIESAAVHGKSLPPLGIVIPNYNHVNLVGAAIESALAQNHPNVQVIVVDDGSTDGSREVIAAYSSRIKVLLQTNTGHVKACLNGAQKLDTPIVMFLDADDLLAPEAASAVAEAWRLGVSKVQFQLEVIDEGGKSTGVVFPKFPAGYGDTDHRAELLRASGHLSPPTSGNAYARSLLNELSTFDELPRYIDSALNLMAPLFGNVVTLQKRLGFYRIHGNNAWLMREFSLDSIERRMEIVLLQQRFLQHLCNRLSIPFDANRALGSMLVHQEHRLALAKFGQGRSTAEPLFGVLVDTLRVQAGCAYGLAQRLVLMTWAVLVAVLPKHVAKSLFMQRISPSARAPVIESLVRLLSCHRSHATTTTNTESRARAAR